MKLRFEPRLMQALVLDEARRDITFRERCHQRLEPVYGLPEEEQADGFALAYAQLFRERELGRHLEAMLQEFPLLQTCIGEALVLQALSRREEEVELSADRTRLGLRLRLERLANPMQLAPFLRHELMRIADLLDENFGYHPGLDEGPTTKDERRTTNDERWSLVVRHSSGGGSIRERYRVLWDIWIDGRLARSQAQNEVEPALKNSPHVANREGRLREFERAFSFLPTRERRGAFESLWQAGRVTHGQLLRWSQDPVRLLEETGDRVEAGPMMPVPGGLCPLCRFPTYVWARHSPEILPLIKADFPDWTPEEGLCERCYECYQMTTDGRQQTAAVGGQRSAVAN